MLAVGRNARTLSTLPCDHRVIDLSAELAGEALISKDDIVINAAHARFTEAIAGLCRSPNQRFIVLGSTRYLSIYPDAAAEEVRAAQQLLQRSGFAWLMLHPTMIYGASGENNVQRMAALIGRIGIVPLPLGGRSLIQPIHVEDVAACVLAGVERRAISRRVIHIAGPRAVSYGEFIRQIAKTIGRSVVVLPVPAPLLIAAALASRMLPFLPTVTVAEARRLSEDKSVSIDDMRTLLEVEPRDLPVGLMQTLDKKRK